MHLLLYNLYSKLQIVLDIMSFVQRDHIAIRALVLSILFKITKYRKRWITKNNTQEVQNNPQTEVAEEVD